MITEEKLIDWQCRLRTIQAEMRESEDSNDITFDAQIAIEEVLNTLSLVDGY